MYFQWVVFVLYGMVGALFAYSFTMFTTSPLSAFAATAGYQIVMYIVSLSVLLRSLSIYCLSQLYLAGYLLTLTYAKKSEADHIITIIRMSSELAGYQPSHALV